MRWPPRQPRLLAAALVALALPASASACAFWDLTGWSDRLGDVTPDAAPPVDAAAGCAAIGDGALFCDDFEPPARAWNLEVVGDACAIGVIVPEAGTASPPSPPHVFFAESHSVGVNQEGFAYEEKDIPGSFDSATATFSVYVDQSDPVSQAAIEELGLEDGTLRRIRVRVWLAPQFLRVDSVVNTPDLPAASFDDVITGVPMTGSAWHRISMSVSRVPSPGFVSVTLDGQSIVARRPLRDGDRVTSSLPHLALRNGIRYLGVPPQPPGWRIFLDDVAVVVP